MCRLIPGVQTVSAAVVNSNVLPTGARVIKGAGPTNEAAEKIATELNAARGITYVVDSRTLDKRSGGVSAAAVTYDYIGKAGCIANVVSGNGHASNFDGWVKNHYAWCQVGGIVIKKLVDKQVVATLSARHVFEARGTRTSRTMTFLEYFDRMVLAGEWSGGVTMNLFMNCWADPTPDQCKPSAGRELWATTGFEFAQKYTIANAKKGTKKPDYKGYTVAQPWIQAYDSTGQGTVISPDVTYRCDSAPYTQTGNACIFHRVAGTMTYDRKDKAVAEAAKHIYDAQIHPEKTYPRWKGKKIPARLHRLYHDKKRRYKNTDIAVKTCKAHWPHYNTKTKDCDEFPFASTKEGASTALGRYSARPIDQTQNRTAGRRLGTWYSADHILEGDAYYVVIR